MTSGGPEGPPATGPADGGEVGGAGVVPEDDLGPLAVLAALDPANDDPS